MSTLTILAIVLQLADSSQTCAALSRGARETNPLLGSTPTCAAVVGLKGAALVPLAFPLPPRYRTAVQVGNIGAGSLGIGISVVTFWGRR